ncbi:LmbE family N-acetylglucosaminyl deacetylase/CheY-like chemotaxis protein [Microbacteriaceae bacterium SG_E_30_P1]|uniref:LmbE family N-acetylglucosaminyl deacetylase/CheY-like chemotaxis protein n=1 Tax=Antiquaquibacter oligotrophicus TaxID=2880260 RepID=A0ABT6KRW0_9MICO|nr:response regulator [Antiquaquibacter oligotrophicus]MDH6181937.1 LmbE family N-acetylglucosaminyl deacetylase/CheY-like chemotaxis protein [Antiquaquibacter oligotrophicus]UDF12393.1 response regulator [Antiquaquibacter oligotrophicus]
MTDNTYRVLVVDDDPDVALYVSTVLERRGPFVVRTAGDAFAALAAVEAFVPHVVVTDIEMPGMTGLEFMGKLNEIRPDVPVVVVTAHVSVEYAVGALRARADEFLTKPINSTALVETVLRLARTGRAMTDSVPHQTVLAIGAHPDDVEIGVGGILSSHRAAGDSVVILTLSRGAQGGSADNRQAESLRAAELLGARLFLEDFTDTEITSAGPTVKAIERVVNEVNPTTVYTHTSHDRHQDHRAVHEASIVATRTIDTVACYQSPSATVDFRPTRFVSIDGFSDSKLDLLACFASQAEIRAYLEPDFVLATARYWSRYGGGRLVEPLEVIRETSDLSTPARRRVANA